MTDLSGSEFDALFDRFAASPTSTTVFRWEAQQSYSVGREEESVAAWRNGDPRPERSVRTSPWLARIARSVVVDGKVWRRVRYVVEPWSDYTRYQMEGYRESQAAGDQPHFTTVQLAAPHPDFWLFSGVAADDKYAVVMHYGQDNALQRFEYADAPDRLAALHTVAAEAGLNAVPLNTYLARHVVAGSGGRRAGRTRS